MGAPLHSQSTTMDRRHSAGTSKPITSRLLQVLSRLLQGISSLEQRVLALPQQETYRSIAGAILARESSFLVAARMLTIFTSMQQILTSSGADSSSPGRLLRRLSPEHYQLLPPSQRQVIFEQARPIIQPHLPAILL